jgi:nuclear pore complex protein Nup62
MLRGKTIEEIVNKWSTDLETHVKEFNRLAGEINVWDRALIDNGNTVSLMEYQVLFINFTDKSTQIAALFQHLVMAEREQSDIDQSLKHVEEQQKELSATLEVYEKSLGELLDTQSGHRSVDVGPADAERDKQ